MDGKEHACLSELTHRKLDLVHQIKRFVLNETWLAAWLLSLRLRFRISQQLIILKSKKQ